MSKSEKAQTQAGREGDWVSLGVLLGSHGVKGHVKLKPFTEEPAAIFTFSSLYIGAGGKSVELKKIRPLKQGFVVSVSGITSPEEAKLLSGKELYVSRADFDDVAEDEFYLADLIGLKVLDEEGCEVGFVRSVENYGSDDLLELVLDEPVKGLGRNVFIPFTKLLVPEVNISSGHVSIALEAWKETQVSERDVEDEE